MLRQIRPAVNSEPQPGKYEQAHKIMLGSANKKVTSGSISHRLRSLTGSICIVFQRTNDFLWLTNLVWIEHRWHGLNGFSRIYFRIRAHPCHPCNPCSITILLLTDDTWSIIRVIIPLMAFSRPMRKHRRCRLGCSRHWRQAIRWTAARLWYCFPPPTCVCAQVLCIDPAWSLFHAPVF